MGYIFSISTPSPFGHSPYIPLRKHRGRGWDVFRFRPCSDFMSHTPQCYGAWQGRSLEVALYSFAMNRRSGLYFSNSTPSPCGHSPYIPLRKHRGRGGLTLLLPLQVFLTPLLVATLLSSPLYFALQNTGEEGNTSFGNEVRFYCFAVRIPWCYGAGERLKRFFCSLSKGGV